ncbi:hypothetical protein KCU81_g3269, partial [Aureobasidium melanogenum]|uniref:Uncharacterized protein n=1 Tax=Aureobasidium melanogenum (strain CBS 110374) TaxID=1043003 RepID=A0A074VW30_AURM1
MTFIFTSYFERFPHFDHQPRQSIRIEFTRLAKTHKWDSEETKRERVNCYNEELEGHFHRLSITDQLGSLKHLCSELDVKPRNTVDGCRKILRYTHVNLVDLMDARRDENTKVKKFKTYKELRDYSHKTKKFYPLDETKGETIEVPLRKLKTPKI